MYVTFFVCLQILFSGTCFDKVKESDLIKERRMACLGRFEMGDNPAGIVFFLSADFKKEKEGEILLYSPISLTSNLIVL